MDALARWDAEVRDRVSQGFRQLPGPRTVAALRALLGLSAYQVGVLAGVSPVMVASFERGDLDFRYWHVVSRRLHYGFSGHGGGWCEPDTHEGANCVYVIRGAATDRQAIEAALALMGHRARSPRRRVGIETLAQRIARQLDTPAQLVRAELAGKRKLSARVRSEAFRQLGGGPQGAGGYFRAASPNGWREVGCDFRGAWW